MATIDKSTREEYIELLRKELLGPGSEISLPDEEHELISEPANARYAIGVLYPQSEVMVNEEDDTIDQSEEGEDSEILDNIQGEEDFVEIKEKSQKEFADGDERDQMNDVVSLSAQNKPASLGFTFFAAGNCDRIAVDIKYGTYRAAFSSDCRVPIEKELALPLNPPISQYLTYDETEKTLKILDNNGFEKKTVYEWDKKELLVDRAALTNAAYILCEQKLNGMVRVPHAIENLEVDFTEDFFDTEIEDGDSAIRITAIRHEMGDKLYSITIMLVNNSSERDLSKNCIFQPVIRISSDGADFSFITASDIVEFDSFDEEEKSLELQYRNKKNYGTGLGCAVNWNIDADGKGFICSDCFPSVEVPGMDFNLSSSSDVSKNSFSMKYLSDLDESSKEEKVSNLNSVVDAYGLWIKETEQKIDSLPVKFHDIARKNMAGCSSSYERMKKGIELLKKDSMIWDAFQLANRAMFMQRIHLGIQKKYVDRFPGDDELNDVLYDIDYYEEADLYFWRPFQLAFLLMSIESIIDDNSKDREIVDLIWFPTGGGKTEAYLGLTAFTIFFRKMKYPEQSGGTAVLMRYTLRLLTAQQFNRASTLICACEFIRYEAEQRRSTYPKYPLGKEEITIGLWIGSEHAPNKNSEARECLKELESATASNLAIRKEKYNKFQVLKCPWCGTKLTKEADGKKLIGEYGYRMKDSKKHFEFFCPQDDCFYNDKRDHLPIQVVDEELYEHPPTLLFGTVDKFAMLPWRAETGSFFGEKSQNRAPELIIQDELHLISGPLGTMVGLYETIIDSLCELKGNKAKVIASTATIRRAKEQCAALYDREVAQFPHPAIDAEDSFFAREIVLKDDSREYGRKYVGLLPSGKTKAMMEVRVIAGLMQIINDMELPDEVKDKYWTLTAYFNTLKELGKCTTLVADDVKDYIKRITHRHAIGSKARHIGVVDELTSRVGTSDLNATLDKLEKTAYSKDNIENGKFASSILLATNMISVGIDVARLNTMLMVSQPKTTSEYIQASSRVGREFPGVVFMQYDSGRSRDRSFYEQFKSYHQAFYRYVEPTGLTPYSEPARDRALHAVVIAMLRHMNGDLYEEEDACNFNVEKYEESIAAIKEIITKRNASINNRIDSNLENDAEAISLEIDRIAENWQDLVDGENGDILTYGVKYMVKNPEDSELRLMRSYDPKARDNAFDTMTSMRGVEQAAKCSVLIWEDEDE